MKHLIIALLAFTSLVQAQTTEEQPFQANYSMLLRWDEGDPVDLVEKWHVHIRQIPTPADVNPIDKTVVAFLPALQLVEMLRDCPNGKYVVTVIAINSMGLEAIPSDPIYILWHWRPAKVTGLRIEFIPNE